MPALYSADLVAVWAVAVQMKMEGIGFHKSQYIGEHSSKFSTVYDLSWSLLSSSFEKLSQQYNFLDLTSFF